MGRPRPERYQDPFDHGAPGYGVSEYLDDLDAWKKQGNWAPASGGTERPFKTRTGRTLQYMYQAQSGRHAYYDPEIDMIVDDDEELRGKYGMAPNARPPLPPPPRSGRLDASRRVSRMMSEYDPGADDGERRDEQFDPEREYERGTSSHHFTLNRSGKFRLTTVDGEYIDLTFREFYAANEGMDPEEAVEIMALQPGETYRGGGGASPEWSIRRLA